MRGRSTDEANVQLTAFISSTKANARLICDVTESELSPADITRRPHQNTYVSASALGIDVGCPGDRSQGLLQNNG
jgi:hypothetical protein